MDNIRPENVLLTGATGFLGSHLLRELLLSGRRVIATVRSSSSYHRISDLLGDAKLVLVDSTPDSLENVFEQRNVGVIVHTATEYGRGDMPIASILEANLVLPIRLAELGAKYDVRGFINADSYFNKPGGSYSNLLNYSLSKRSLLVWLEKFSTRISIANVVLEHMYGPWDSRGKFVEDMIQAIAIERRAFVDLTYGHQKRDFIFVSDVVDAFMKILGYIESHSFPLKTFEVGRGESTQVRSFVSDIAGISNSPTALNFGAVDYRDDEIMNSHADIRGMLELGWAPTVSPEAGIQKILEVYAACNL